MSKALSRQLVVKTRHTCPFRRQEAPCPKRYPLQDDYRADKLRELSRSAHDANQVLATTLLGLVADATPVIALSGRMMVR